VYVHMCVSAGDPRTKMSFLALVAWGTGGWCGCVAVAADRVVETDGWRDQLHPRGAHDGCCGVDVGRVMMRTRMST